ncbi:MAG: glycosyl transferase [Alphaproteobacteria bacterium PA4]|nr:MAG: glycosyl transferase [Alphaproteobacteria bacterium PA4]
MSETTESQTPVGDTSAAPGVTPDAPRVSVIIPHLNTPDVLAVCLTSVAGQHLDHGHAEIIVVDNGSKVSMDQVKADFPAVRFLLEPQPGPGLARNRGIAAARASVLVFIDADCRAEAGWLQAAVDAVEADPERAVIGGDVRIDVRDESRLTDIEAYEAVFGFRQQLYIEKKNFSGAGNLAIAAHIHGRVGPFCGIEKAEDLDWGLRAHAAGYPPRYVPAMRIYHPARPDFAALQRKWERHIGHEFHDHKAAGRPMLIWHARAAAMIASIPVDGVRLITSDRLSGVGNRLKGLAVLARIRIYRAAEMLRLAGQRGDASKVDSWNRQ